MCTRFTNRLIINTFKITMRRLFQKLHGNFPQGADEE